MNTFHFEFDELPLVIIENGTASGEAQRSRIEGGMVNGRAKLNYTRNGDWTIIVIELEGFGPRDPKTGQRTWPYVAAPAAVAEIIAERLQNQWAAKVLNAVIEQIENDHEAAEDDRADMLRERNADDL